MAFFDTLKDRLTGATDAVTGKAKEGATIARLSNEKYALERELDKLYMNIGKAVAEDPQAAPDALIEAVGEARALREKIEGIEGELRRLRSKNVCPACGFVADKKARFCPSCGSALMEAGTRAETVSRPAREEEARESIVITPVVSQDFRKDE